MLKRICNPLLSRSFFLFGASRTGKTTLVKELIPPAKRLLIDLLLPSQYDEFALNPEILVNVVGNGTLVLPDSRRHPARLLS